MNSQVRERVYTFPEWIDFGHINVADLKANPSLVGLLSQTLMVYQAEGEKFHAKTMTDLSIIELRSEDSPLGDRCQIQIEILPQNLRPGTIDGAIGIQTNDPEFPLLHVPVRGHVEGTW